MKRTCYVVCILILAVLFGAAFSLSGCLLTRPANAVPAGTVAAGEVCGNALSRGFEATFSPPAGTTWRKTNAVRVWLAKLDGTLVAYATDIDYDAENQVLHARFGKNVSPQEEPLYLVRYEIGVGDDRTTASFSLAQVLGALQVRILGPDTFQTGSRGAIRIIAHDRFSGEPLPGATITVTFRDEKAVTEVFRGQSADDGTCDISFDVPARQWQDAALVVAAQWRGQEVSLEHEVTLRHDTRILLTSDKPLYQPGQTMHLRALALGKADRQPAAGRLAWLEVQDGKGNKVFKKKLQTNRFGIFAADFVLADQVNLGTYRISAIEGETSVEKTVEVKHYVLPKFKVKIDADRSWYLPAATIRGTIDAQYLFGKPVSGAKVAIEGLATIVGVEKFVDLTGKTNAEGRFDFELRIPDTLTGRPVDQGKARVQVHAVVTDAAGHTQEALRSYPVARAPLVAQVLPESGELVPGLENRLFILVTTPDGTPVVDAKVALQPGKAPRQDDWWTLPFAAATDAFGLTEMRVNVPDDSGFTITVRARTAEGSEIEETLRLRPERTKTPLLLRTDAPTYRMGDVIQLIALVGGTSTRTVFFDLVRDNQTLLTASAAIAGGRAEAQIPVTAEMTGGVVATAYVFTPEGNAVRDTRLIYIHPEADLKVAITPRKDTYRPGEAAAIDVAVTDLKGHPVAAALGITIVDEAVFALQDMQPGLEKIFFTLEKELMKPRYEIHTFQPEIVVLDPRPDPTRKRGQTAMLAAIAPAVVPAIDEKQATDLRSAVVEKLRKQIEDDLQRVAVLYAKHKGDTNRIDIAKLSDPWFHPYRISAAGARVYRLVSAGPDRQFATDDDLTVEDPKYVEERKKMAEAQRAFGAGGFAGRGNFEGAVDLFEDEDRAMAKGEALKEPAAATRTVDGSRGDSGPAIRVREYFPETLFVDPSLITDGQGNATLNLDMADSITTWRIAAQAVSAKGWLGSGTAPVRVFQDFFIDIDFPVALTRHDEVKVPIALYNYLERAQTVTLNIEAADWFELLDGGLQRQVLLQPGEVKAETLHVKATKVGRHALTVYARGSKQSDAVKRVVRVEPDGEMQETNITDRLPGEVSQNVEFPDGAIPGANVLLVKIHPGLVSQVLEGLDNIFRMPSGCFEQTSSTTYPNVMVLDYMKASRQITPELQMKAEGFINQGYQRLLTFEVPGGGFEWFGRGPAHIILTAYGLMEFHDMSRVYEVDEAVIVRTQEWLAGMQQQDGSWKPNQQFLDRVAAKFANDVLRNTAYVTWALGRTEYQGKAVRKGVAYLEKHHADAKDAYTLALLANALVAGKASDAIIDKVFSRLADMRVDEEDQSYWPAESTAVGSRGKSSDIETTALAGMVLVAAHREPQTVNRIVNYLISAKDSFGTYYSTQATVFAMHVLLGAAQAGGRDVEGKVDVFLNGEAAGAFDINPDNAEVLRMLDVSDRTRSGQNEIKLTFAGKGEPAYQIVARHYMPWGAREKPGDKEALSIDVSYDKQSLRVDETVACRVTIRNQAPGTLGMVVVDVGVPPGFQPLRETLTKLVEEKTVSKFSTTARQVTFYLDELRPEQKLKLEFDLKALYPVRAAAPATKVYEYYNPETNATSEPTTLVITK
ncbi:MAG: alpha-2-macroglobulin family protein [Candidatus Lernaella stagnicola]|nr:alpha-2-macroglobulin family protein [Candidatus Lernaella stagnicola]